MSKRTQPCSKCGNPCWGTSCRSCGWGKGPTMIRFDCEQCGTLCERRASKRRTPRFCSVACSNAHAVAAQGNRLTASCEVCGLEFTRKVSDFKRRDGNRGGRFCSKACHGAWKRQQPKKPPKPQPKPAPRSRVYFRNCKMCERLFCSKSPLTRYCSAQCRIDNAGTRTNDLYALATRYNKLTGVYEGATWRQALNLYLLERDGDKCQICRRKIDITLKSGTKGSRKGPSVDHIIPRSLGGTDDLANLRLTHWGCNQSRGNRGGNEQLMLVG